jgi:pimeloyl-ACP methyl ester carboxylesterase
VNQVRGLKQSDAANRTPVLGAPPSYWLDLRGYDPPMVAKTLSVPLLVLQGERDYQVTMTDDFVRWQSTLASKPGVTFKTYPALNHLFMAGTGKSLPAEYYVPGHVSADVVRDIATWITSPRPK